MTTFIALERGVAGKDYGIEHIAIAAKTLAQPFKHEFKRGLAGSLLDAGYFFFKIITFQWNAGPGYVGVSDVQEANGIYHFATITSGMR